MARAIEIPHADRRFENQGLPPPGFSFRVFFLALGVGDRETRPDSEGGELIDGAATRAPVGKLLFIEQGSDRITASGSSWLQSTRIVQRKRRPTSNVAFDDRVARQARRNRFEIGNLAERAAGHSGSSSFGLRARRAKSSILGGQTGRHACVALARRIPQSAGPLEAAG
jgi:hypothetical protein